MRLSDEIRTIVHAFGDKARKDNIRRIAKRAERLEDFAEDWANEPCEYGDWCPSGSRHGRCTPCKARTAMEVA